MGIVAGAEPLGIAGYSAAVLVLFATAVCGIWLATRRIGLDLVQVLRSEWPKFIVRRNSDRLLARAAL